MNQNTFYTSQNLWDLTRMSPDFPFISLMKTDVNSSVGYFFSFPAYTAPLTWWRLEKIPLKDVMPESVRDNFIGMLSPEEAARMTSELNLFKKRFDEDFKKRNKVLFGK